MSFFRRFAGLAASRLHNRTVRMRLTLLYGSLFLLLGAALLGITYGLVSYRMSNDNAYWRVSQDRMVTQQADGTLRLSSLNPRRPRSTDGQLQAPGALDPASGPIPRLEPGYLSPEQVQFLVAE